MIDNNQKRIEIKNLSKSFWSDCRTRFGALSFFISFFVFKKDKKKVVVAKDISFEVKAGEILGVIGRNGAGKSSLLRLIAEIYHPDSGYIKTFGKVVYLSSFGHGLMQKLTMRENVFLMGSILGLSQKEIKNKFAEIVEFSGLGNHIDMKVYQFSSGMIARLVFSVMVHCISHHKPDILLIDEMLSAGGDADFQEKATMKMESLIKGGAAVILVSHDLEILKKYCNQMIWIQDGEIVKRGDTSVVINGYLNNFK